MVGILFKKYIIQTEQGNFSVWGVGARGGGVEEANFFIVVSYTLHEIISKQEVHGPHQSPENPNFTSMIEYFLLIITSYSYACTVFSSFSEKKYQTKHPFPLSQNTHNLTTMSIYVHWIVYGWTFNSFHVSKVITLSIFM